MGTKGTRSSGTQYNPKGATQGNTLVDPKTGLPIDVITDSSGTRRLAVDANITVDEVTIDTRPLDASTDNVALKDTVTGAKLKINNDGSIDTNVALDAAGGDNLAIHDSDGDELEINPDGSINVREGGLTAPTVFNFPIVAAATEYSYTFPANTKKFTLNARGNAKVQLSYTAGQSGTDFKTLYSGSVHKEDKINLASLTVYFQANKAGEVLEILSWV